MLRKNNNPGEDQSLQQHMLQQHTFRLVLFADNFSPNTSSDGCAVSVSSRRSAGGEPSVCTRNTPSAIRPSTITKLWSVNNPFVAVACSKFSGIEVELSSRNH